MPRASFKPASHSITWAFMVGGVAVGDAVGVAVGDAVGVAVGEAVGGGGSQ